MILVFFFMPPSANRSFFFFAPSGSLPQNRLVLLVLCIGMDSINHLAPYINRSNPDTISSFVYFLILNTHGFSHVHMRYVQKISDKPKTIKVVVELYSNKMFIQL